ncbi:MAG: ATP-binding protein [Pseudomonadales bacterium]
MTQLATIPPEHPLLNPLQLKLMTPEVRALKTVLKQWLWTGSTGGFIQGTPRVGKTTALRMVGDQLTTRTGATIPSHLFSVPPSDKRSIAMLYRNLCLSAGFELPRPRQTNSEMLLDTFYHYLMDKAYEAGSNRVVLFVDEMQRLAIGQIEAFAQLHDMMGIEEVSLTVIFTGNDIESDGLLNAIEASERRHIQGRFFTQGHEFKGITKKSDLKACLGQYDTLRYPINTGATYTECCVPKWFRNGWRLQHLTDEVWEVYRDYQRQYNLRGWGMLYFVNAVNVLLLDYLPKHGADNFSRKMMNECIKVSGLIPSMVRPAG